MLNPRQKFATIIFLTSGLFLFSHQLPNGDALAQKARKRGVVTEIGPKIPDIREDPEIIIFSQPCKGETPGNVLGVSEQADTKTRVRGFIGKLRDSNPKTRACAIRQLGYLGNDATSALPYVLTLFREDPNDGVRTNATGALWEIGPDSTITVEEHLELIDNQDVYVRLYAAFVLGYFKPVSSQEKAVIQALTHAVRDQDNTVRWVALKGLARLGPLAGAAVPVLLELLDDKDPAIRSAAVTTLGYIRLITANP